MGEVQSFVVVYGGAEQPHAGIRIHRSHLTRVVSASEIISCQ